MKKTNALLIPSISFVLGCALTATFVMWQESKKPKYDITINKNVEDNDPACLRMYHYIELYADSFDIPKQYAYGIANAETGYRGPLHWKYNHRQTSSVGAVGPMQIMPSTARWINKERVSAERLRSDIEYNVMTSMKLLRYLHDKNNDWLLAFGEYNTGKPCINKYANKVYSYQGNQHHFD